MTSIANPSPYDFILSPGEPGPAGFIPYAAVASPNASGFAKPATVDVNFVEPANLTANVANWLFKACSPDMMPARDHIIREGVVFRRVTVRNATVKDYATEDRALVASIWVPFLALGSVYERARDYKTIPFNENGDSCMIAAARQFLRLFALLAHGAEAGALENPHHSVLELDMTAFAARSSKAFDFNLNRAHLINLPQNAGDFETGLPRDLTLKF